MTNPDYTAIAIVVDRSGSVYHMKEEMENSVNNFVKDQAKQDGELSILLAEFDEHYNVVYNRKGKRFAKYNLVPRGMTALLDAIGKTINDLGEELTKLPEEKRPGKVLVVVVTDGLENASKEYSKETIKKMIKTQQEVYKWEFVFLAANQDAILTGSQYGFESKNSLTYDTANVESAMRSLSGLAINYRSGESIGFSEQDRENAK